VSGEACGLCKGSGHIPGDPEPIPCPQCARNEAARVASVKAQMEGAIDEARGQMDVLLNDMIRLSNEWSRRQSDNLRLLIQYIEEARALLMGGKK